MLIGMFLIAGCVMYTIILLALVYGLVDLWSDHNLMLRHKLFGTFLATVFGWLIFPPAVDLASSTIDYLF